MNLANEVTNLAIELWLTPKKTPNFYPFFSEKKWGEVIFFCEISRGGKNILVICEGRQKQIQELWGEAIFFCILQKFTPPPDAALIKTNPLPYAKVSSLKVFQNSIKC